MNLALGLAPAALIVEYDQVACLPGGNRRFTGEHGLTVNGKGPFGPEAAKPVGGNNQGRTLSGL